MNNKLPGLKDIEGIDPVSFWPLGPGWWFVIGLLLILIISLLWIYARRRAFRRSWKYDALAAICELEMKLSAENAAESLILLSEFLRRIAVARYSRKECAGLLGDAWLEWLSKKDPSGFDWRAKGKVLIDAPYAPHDRALSLQEVKEYIHAIKGWVK